jgi:hypothetical protein
MSAYPPPTETLPIFNVNEFIGTTSTSQGGGGGGGTYVNYPNAQGVLNLVGLNSSGTASITNLVVNGTSDINNNVNISGDIVFDGINGSINFLDATEQVSAYTGAGALSGAYTNSNITLDTDGKITAISNGSGVGLNPTFDTITIQDPSAPTNTSVISQTGSDFTITNNETASVIQLIADTTEVQDLLADSVEYSGDGTAQVSAYTGAGAIAGSYTSTNLTVDANGRITALANGSGGTNILPLNNAFTGTNSYSQPSSFIDGADNLTIDQIGIDSFITNDQTDGTIFLKSRNGGGTMIDTLTINSGSNGIVALANLNMSNLTIDGIGNATYTDTTEQTSAFTGAGSFAGSYTNTDMTIDGNGRITAIANGSAGVGSPKPYFWATGTGITQQYPTTINIKNTSFSGWTTAMFYTIRLNLVVSYNGGASVYTLDTMMDIYPSRINSQVAISQSLSTNSNNPATNAINGNTSFNYTNATYAPLGRWFWSHQITSTGTMGSEYIMVYVPTATEVGIQIVNPNGRTSSGAYSVNIMTELVSKGAGGTFTFQNLVATGAYQFVGSG